MELTRTTTNGSGLVTGDPEGAPWLIHNRNLVSRGAKAGEMAHMHLEGVRDTLRQIAEKQESRDLDRSFSQMHLNFNNGRITAQMLGPNGLEGDVMLVHKNAYDQMSQSILPARFGSGLLEQALLGSEGAKLSTMNWFLWSKQSSNPRMFRTVRIRDPHTGKVMPCLRSQHSQGYATYDNLGFVQDLLDNAPDLAGMPVIEFRLSDTGLKLRFALDNIDEIQTNVPIRIIEAWNSEVGRRRTGLISAIWKLICANGMTTWNPKAEWWWRHFGNTQRIRDGVASSITELRTEASGVLEAYNAAGNVAIDDAFAWMDAELKGQGVTKDQIDKAQKALTHDTTTPGGVLASVVDATTLIAQEYEMFEQATLERAAARLLQRGRAQALRNNGRIQVAQA